MLRSVDVRALVAAAAGALLSAGALRISVALSGNPELGALWVTWVIVMTGVGGVILVIFFTLVYAVMESVGRLGLAIVFLVVPLIMGSAQALVTPFLIKRFEVPTLGFLLPFLVLSYLLYLGAIWVNRGEKGVEQRVDWNSL